MFADKYGEFSVERSGFVLVVRGKLGSIKDTYFVVGRETSQSKFGLYSLPGGKPKDGETLRQTAERECKEETGFKLDAARLRDGKTIVCTHKKEVYAMTVFTYEAQGAELEAAVSSTGFTDEEDNPLTEVGFKALSELPEDERAFVLQTVPFLF